MTAKVTQMFPLQSMVPTEIPLTTKLSPAEYRSPFTSPGVPNFIVVSSCISSRDTYPQQDASQQPPSPAVAVSRLETWSDSASEETYIFYSPARDSDGLQILPTQSPSNHQILSSRI